MKLIFGALLFLTLSTATKVDAHEDAHKKAVFLHPKNIIIYVENFKCANEEKVSVRECYPSIKQNASLPKELTPYNLGFFLKEIIEKKYLPPDFPAHKDKWGRMGQKAEVLSKQEAYGSKALEYKKNPDTLFLKIIVRESNYGGWGSDKNYKIQILVDAFRFSPEISPFSNRFYGCVVEPSLKTEAILAEVQKCFNGIQNMNRILSE